MTTGIRTTTQALRTAVDRAILAPSVHNSQPWRFVLRPEELEIRADRARQLAVLDPTGRQMYLSIGCAVFNARSYLAATDAPVRVAYLPDGPASDVIARFDRDDGVRPDAVVGGLEPYISKRQTNRRQFTDDAVPAQVVDELIDSARAEGARLVLVDQEDDRLTLARLTQRADTAQITDPAYRAELRHWTSGDDGRRDGVPARVVPHVDGTAGDDVPIRDFDTRGLGWLPAETRSSTRQCLLVLGTDADGPLDWVRAGQALERVWLEITKGGFVASLFTQPIEVAPVRLQLREELRLDIQPHVVLRVGKAPITAATMRRVAADMLLDQTG